MKVNGTQAIDPTTSRLFVRQRWVIPLWVSALGVMFRATVGGVARLVTRTVRAWTLTAPAVVLGWLWISHGRTAAEVTAALALFGLLVWRVVHPSSFRELVAARLRGWWRWQLAYRRGWFAGMDGAGLTRKTPSGAVYLPTVSRVRSTPVVDRLSLRLLHGQTPAELQDGAERMRHTFGAYRCTVRETKPGRVLVTFYARDPLVQPFEPWPLSGLPDLTAVPVALSETGDVFTLRVLDRHILIAGSSGAGKGSVLWSILHGLAPAIASGLVAVTGIDPKGGMELHPGRALFTHYADGTPVELVEMLEDRVKAMTARKERMRAAKLRSFTPTAADPLEVIVLDELAFLTAYLGDVKLRQRAKEALTLLLSQGRAVGFIVIGALQDPRKDVIPFRDLFTLRIALRLVEDGGADLTLGDGAQDKGARCHEIPDTSPGVAYVRVEGGDVTRVRFPYTTDTHIQHLADTYPAPVNRPRTPTTGGASIPAQPTPVHDTPADDPEPA